METVKKISFLSIPTIASLAFFVLMSSASIDAYFVSASKNGMYFSYTSDEYIDE